MAVPPQIGLSLLFVAATSGRSSVRPPQGFSLSRSLVLVHFALENFILQTSKLSCYRLSPTQPV